MKKLLVTLTMLSVLLFGAGTLLAFPFPDPSPPPCLDSCNEAYEDCKRFFWEGHCYIERENCLMACIP